MTRKTRDATNNYIDHSYADQSPVVVNQIEDTSQASSTSSASSYVNSDHSYHVSAYRGATKRKASSTRVILNKKLRKSVRVSSRKASTRAAEAVASAADQVTSSTVVASPSSQLVILYDEDQSAQKLSNQHHDHLTPPIAATASTDAEESLVASNTLHLSEPPQVQLQLNSIISTDQAPSQSPGNRSSSQMVNVMDEAFGRFVTSSLACMSARRRNMTRLRIMQVINECMLANCD